MASLMKLSRRPKRPKRWNPDDPGIDKTIIEVIEYLEEENELRTELELYRQGGALMSLCHNCGLPLPASLTLGEWVQVPLICKYCILEL
jgi:hypothetical protein